MTEISQIHNWLIFVVLDLRLQNVSCVTYLEELTLVCLLVDYLVNTMLDRFFVQTGPDMEFCIILP